MRKIIIIVILSILSVSNALAYDYGNGKHIDDKAKQTVDASVGKLSESRASMIQGKVAILLKRKLSKKNMELLEYIGYALQSRTVENTTVHTPDILNTPKTESVAINLPVVQNIPRTNTGNFNSTTSPNSQFDYTTIKTVDELKRYVKEYIEIEPSLKYTDSTGNVYSVGFSGGFVNISDPSNINWNVWAKNIAVGQNVLLMTKQNGKNVYMLTVGGYSKTLISSSGTNTGPNDLETLKRSVKEVASTFTDDRGYSIEGNLGFARVNFTGGGYSLQVEASDTGYEKFISSANTYAGSASDLRNEILVISNGVAHISLGGFYRSNYNDPEWLKTKVARYVDQGSGYEVECYEGCFADQLYDYSSQKSLNLKYLRGKLDSAILYQRRGVGNSGYYLVFRGKYNIITKEESDHKNLLVWFHNSQEEVDKYTKELNDTVASITNGTSGADEKARKIDTWIIANIRYNVKMFAVEYPDGKSYDPKSKDTINTWAEEDKVWGGPSIYILKYKKAYCVGFAGLFKDMLKIAGVDSKFIVGTLNGVGHAWNKVGDYYVEPQTGKIYRSVDELKTNGYIVQSEQ